VAVSVTLGAKSVLASAAVNVILVVVVVHEIPASVGYDHVGVKLYGFARLNVLLDQEPRTTVYSVTGPGFSSTNRDELSTVSVKVIPVPYPAVIETVWLVIDVPGAAVRVIPVFVGVHVIPDMSG
jgi:hypothetical protein